jgi:two-component sensor histidine kinase
VIPFALSREIIRSPLSGSIRARVVALGLIAAIPAAGMAGIIAGQDYTSRERVAIEHVARLQGLAIARIDVAVASLDAALVGLAGALPVTARLCTAMFPQDFHLAPHDAPPLALLDAAGKVVCSSGTDTALRRTDVGDTDWFRRAEAGAAPALGTIAGGDVTVVAVAAPGGRVLAAVLPPDWFAKIGRPDIDAAEAAIWLFDANGNIVASNGLATEALPDITTLVKLNRSKDATLLAPSAGGIPYAYASTRLSNGWQVIGAYRSTREHVKALRVLYTRLADLAALLLLGLAVTVLGADIAFGDPLRRLRTALADWQAGGGFDEHALASAPTELVELARSFNQSTISLQEQKAELERARARQELLMLEIHHRVKNNLQIVASLLNLQASRIRVPEARAEFQSARDRVRALATLHRHLYSEGEIHTINMPSFLAELCGQLFQAMGETQGERIKLMIEAAELRLSTDQAVPLALIVTEAVTNAIKYGFPGGRSGTVSIRLTQCEAALDLVIADDGVGIPPGPSETETGTRDGIGLQLIRGFSRQLGATLEVTQQPGTCYRIHMPMRGQPDGRGGVTDLEA